MASRIISLLELYYLSCIHVSTAIVLMNVKEQTNRYCKMKPTNGVKVLKILQLHLTKHNHYYILILIHVIAFKIKPYP